MSNSNITAQPIITRQNGKLITTSLAIDQHFNKSHRDVLKSIRRLDCSKEFNESNFSLVEYLDAKGEKRPIYEITRDGFMLDLICFFPKNHLEWYT